MAFNPLVPPQEPDQLLPYLNDEFGRVAAEFNAVQNGEWPIHYAIPEKYKPGTIKLFDGTQANPLGTGKQGLYRFGTDNLWHFMENEPYVPPPAPVPPGWTAITPTNGWTVSTAFIYRKWDYRVDLIFGLAAGTYTSGGGSIVVGSLPVAHRPPVDCSFAIATVTLGDINGLPRLRVRTNGDIDIFNVPTGSLGIYGTCSIPIDVL